MMPTRVISGSRKENSIKEFVCPYGLPTNQYAVLPRIPLATPVATLNSNCVSIKLAK